MHQVGTCMSFGSLVPSTIWHPPFFDRGSFSLRFRYLVGERTRLFGALRSFLGVVGCRGCVCCSCCGRCVSLDQVSPGKSPSRLSACLSQADIAMGCMPKPATVSQNSPLVHSSLRTGHILQCLSIRHNAQRSSQTPRTATQLIRKPASHRAVCRCRSYPGAGSYLPGLCG